MGRGHPLQRGAARLIRRCVGAARDLLSERLHGLDCGADDYLVKPFEAAELVARNRADGPLFADPNLLAAALATPGDTPPS